MATYTVTLKFQYPAWDEKNGIIYEDITASSKSDAIRRVRTMAEHDGHYSPGINTGKGRATFTAVQW